MSVAAFTFRTSLRFACLAVALLAGAAQAADHIDTDGPDFVESTGAVPEGRIQFETGPQQTTDRRDGAKLTATSTPLLLKAGISDAVELRLETDGYLHNAGLDAAGAAPSPQYGHADTAIGFKYHVQDGVSRTLNPALAWIVHVELPSGSPALRGLGLRPSVRAVLGWDLPGDNTLGVMPGVKLDTRADGRRFASGILGVVAGHWWTPRLRNFIEMEADSIAHQADGGTILYKNVGGSYLLGDDWQIGARAGWAANHNTPSRYVLLSLAGRF